MAIDVSLTDREVVLLMTLCRLLGKPDISMRDAEEACLRSVQRVNRESRELNEMPPEI